jgi:hypothetical protein
MTMVNNAVVDDKFLSDISPINALGLTDFLVRVRLLLGLVGGIMLGAFHHQSGAGLAAGIGLLYYVPIWYTKIISPADLDSKGGLNGVQMTGILNSVALMVLVWITFFTWFNQDLLLPDMQQEQLQGPSPLLANVDGSL